MLTLDNTVLVIIDVQEKLSRVIYQKEDLLENMVKLAEGIRLLGVPIILTEQNPAGLGVTVPELAEHLEGIQPLTKFSFSCCGEQAFLTELETLKRKQVILAGIETHVCVYQTAMDLIGSGYEVQVVDDCVSSRTLRNKEIGLSRICGGGGSLTSTEIVLFELLKVAKGDIFKGISKIVK